MANNDDFWDNFLKSAYVDVEGSREIDSYLQGHDLEGPHHSAVYDLWSGKDNVKIKKGTRVAFKSDIESLLSMENPPAQGVHGTVVACKTVEGNLTSFKGKVFVDWDDGEFRAVEASCLVPAGDMRRVANPPHRVRVSSLGALSDFEKTASGDLVHKSTKDLWSLKKDGEAYVIERLFDDEGKPLKC